MGESKYFSRKIFLVGLLQISLIAADKATLKTGAGSKPICVEYNPNFNKVLSSYDAADEYTLLNMLPENLCNETRFTSGKLSDGAAVAVARGGCTFSEKGLRAQDMGASAALIVSTTPISSFKANHTSDYKIINISLFLIEETDFKEFQNGSTFRVYKSTSLYTPYLMCLSFLTLAISIIFIGGYWSGLLYMEDLKEARHRSSKDKKASLCKQEKLPALPILYIALLVLFMGGFLVLLYFFYDYVVYVMIGVFCLWSTRGLYFCFWPLVRRMPCSKAQIPANDLPLLRHQPHYTQLLLVFLSAVVAGFWVYIRNDSYAWVLQDVLGAAVVVSILASVRLPNFKFAAVLLIFLFFYDIFFVFGSTLFTKNGESIMVAVATGGSKKGEVSREQLPLAFKLPKIGAATGCFSNQYSLLGFGDIVLPGLLIAFLHGFDMKSQNKNKIYFICTLIAYAVGLQLTFVAMILMNKGQPALLYLVPCLLLTTFFIGWRRGELRHLWTGEEQVKLIEKRSNVDEEDSELTPLNVEDTSSVQGGN